MRYVKSKGKVDIISIGDRVCNEIKHAEEIEEKAFLERRRQ